MGETFIVDWDIPREKRRMFYYHLGKLKKRHGLLGEMSSASVMAVEDEVVAKEVYRLAAKYGHANLYRAQKIR